MLIIRFVMETLSALLVFCGVESVGHLWIPLKNNDTNRFMPFLLLAKQAVEQTVGFSAILDAIKLM